MKLLKRIVPKKTIIIAVAIFLVAASLPTFSAYEAHVINVRVRFEIPSFYKNCVGEKTVNIHEYNEWTCEILLKNPKQTPMTDVVITDTVPGEFRAALISYTPNSAPAPVFNASGNTQITWNVGTLGAGQTAILKFKIWGRCNNGGHWEFTTAGDYILNEGATATWTQDGQTFQKQSPGINVTAIENPDHPTGRDHVDCEPISP